MIDLKNKQYFLFDMDGTLIDLEQLNYTCFRDAVKKASGTDLSFTEYMTYMAGVGSKRGFQGYFNSIGKAISDYESIINGYRENKEFNLRNHFADVVTLKDGIIEFLEKASMSGKKLAVATSTVSKFAHLILEKADMKRYFDVIVTVDDVTNSKPAPDIFFEALKRIQGNVLEAVIFEDSGNGVQSAINSGIDFFVISNPGKNDSVVAASSNVISSYSELLSQLG